MMNKQINWNLFLIYPATEKKTKIGNTSKHPILPSILPCWHTWEKRAFWRASEKLSPSPSSEKMRANFPYFGHFSERLFLLRAKTSHIFLSTRGGRKAKKMSENILVCFCLGSTPLRFIHLSCPACVFWTPRWLKFNVYPLYSLSDKPRDFQGLWMSAGPVEWRLLRE